MPRHPEPGGIRRQMNPERQPPTTLKINLEKSPLTRPVLLVSIKSTGPHE
jgi:hypothetical protein